MKALLAAGLMATALVTCGAGPAGFQAYTETVPGSSVTFEMVPVPAGTFRMGTDAPDAPADEAPAHEVSVSPFWIGAREVTWDEYDVFAWADPIDLDGITGPTQPFVDPTFGLGRGTSPVLCITHHAAMEYARWLSKKTGHAYRLPTEAEWEYVARASGADPAVHAWHKGNSPKKPQPVGTRAADLLGLFDLLGNVAEWVQDAYYPDAYRRRAGTGALGDPIEGPVTKADATFPFVVRGGSWMDAEKELSVSRRTASNAAWSRRDPNFPKSLWWHTDAQHVGFRLARSY